ncbi:Zinc finger, C2H2 domain and Zinc finger C2H2-type/integrase DNA-binding domain-containing protein [Aphelenchoides fujianensis]|nr:Zinc finger, C2H2 domain and Zinc finger C2H2-type/integrase DNA-binding domain-containing protein [Aphelenchoides fujianensis]
MFANSLLMRGLSQPDAALSAGSPPINSGLPDPFTQLLLNRSVFNPQPTPDLFQLLGLLQPPVAPPPQAEILAQMLQLRALCQQPGLLDLIGTLPGAKVVDVREVQEEKPESLAPAAILPTAIKADGRSPPAAPLPSSSASSVASRKRSYRDSETPSPGSLSAPKKSKAMRRLHNADAETNSPVSGMHIKEASEVSADDLLKASELDESATCVKVTEEARRKIADIPNVIGDAVCSLCKVKFGDVFLLAMHRCPRIVHEEYRCPECEKVFSCPANLASHRRWHRPPGADRSSGCSHCPKRFDTKKALREHEPRCPLKPSTSRVPTASTSSPTSFADGSEFHSETATSPEASPVCSSPPPALISLGLLGGSLDVRADLFHA